MDDLFLLEVREKPYFMAKGKMKYKDILTVNLPQILSQLVASDKKIRDSYKNYLSDSKLVGQDKADILEEITDMIISVVTLRLYLNKKIFNLTMVETINKQKGFELKIFLSNFEFLINGYFARKIFDQINTFHYWDETYFMPLYDKLLDTFKIVIADGKITQEDGTILADILDDMLHMLILIYYKLESEYIQA